MNKFQLLGSAIALSFFAMGAQATTFKANYTVNFHDTGPGLEISTSDLAPDPFSLGLSVGQSRTFNLFKIWTAETWVNSDDEQPSPIAVNFDFTEPSIFDGSVNGTTQVKILRGWFHIPYGQEGQLTWNGPADFYYGANNDGHIRISLSDATFNKAIYPFDMQNCWTTAATVKATVALLHDASAPPPDNPPSNPPGADVPEPGMVALFGLGLLGMILGERRRRRG